MTLLTEFLLGHLRERTPSSIRVVDIGRTFRRPGRTWQLRRAFASLVAALTILTARRPGPTTLYLVGNSDSGLPLSALQALAGRIRGDHIVYHHHTTASISDPRMPATTWALGSDAVHVCSGTDLGALITQRFPNATTLHLRPGVRTLRDADSISAVSATADDGIVVGHVSNLTEAKGVLEVIRCVASLRDRGIEANGVIVGPFVDAATEQRSRTEAERTDAPIEFTGPLAGESLDQAIRQFSVFVFPSTYQHESWAMVIDEALAHGVPVVTTRFPGANRVADGGAVVDGDQDLGARMADVVATWIADDPTLNQRRTAAVSAAHRLAADGTAELERFCNVVLAGAQ